jgi:hypothetical protein
MEGNTAGILALLEKQGRSNGAAKPPANVDDHEKEYVAFANGRIGTRPQLAIIFRKADGSAKGLSYAHFYGVEANDPASGFIAEFTQTKVIVKGRNLEELFRFLCQQRIWEVVEAQRNQIFDFSANEPIVECIDFQTPAG